MEKKGVCRVAFESIKKAFDTLVKYYGKYLTKTEKVGTTLYELNFIIGTKNAWVLDVLNRIKFLNKESKFFRTYSVNFKEIKKRTILDISEIDAFIEEGIEKADTYEKYQVWIEPSYMKGCFNIVFTKEVINY